MCNKMSLSRENEYLENKVRSLNLSRKHIYDKRGVLFIS